jgi:hypothetical protein
MKSVASKHIVRSQSPTELLMLEALNMVDSLLRVHVGEPLVVTLIVHPRHKGEKVNVVSNVPKEARGEVSVALAAILKRWGPPAR